MKRILIVRKKTVKGRIQGASIPSMQMLMTARNTTLSKMIKMCETCGVFKQQDDDEDNAYKGTTPKIDVRSSN